VFERHGSGADRAAMAGNSVKSDVIAALDAGGWAAWIPYPITWAHEEAPPPVDHPRFAQIATIAELPAWVRALG
jgi:putative hydrolase of the HAD superfamily